MSSHRSEFVTRFVTRKSGESLTIGAGNHTPTLEPQLEICNPHL
jgi:hypothetical protein